MLQGLRLPHPFEKSLKLIAAVRESLEEVSRVVTRFPPFTRVLVNNKLQLGKSWKLAELWDCFVC
jgi:hypothetical protein